MDKKNVLETIEQKTVVFYDDELTAIKANDSEIYVSVRHVCGVLGLDDFGQRQRIGRHAVLQKGLMVCKIQTIMGIRDTYVLRADMLPLWLSGVRASKVKEEVRVKLEKFQLEAAKVLWEAFQEGRLTADTEFEELLNADTPTAQAYKMIMAMAKMARQQLLHEAKIEQHEEQLGEHSERIEQLEATLGNPDRYITPEQASNVSQAVKAIAIELSRASGRNEFGGVYGEMYRRAGVTSYKEIPASKYEEVMTWLRDWYGSLADDMPF